MVSSAVPSIPPSLILPLMETSSEELLERIDALYHSSVKNEVSWGVFKKQRTVQGLEGIVGTEAFSDRLWVTNERLGRKGRVAPPSRKATVMIIGNHSSGKSSFINWYANDAIQSTGIALETTHFTMVTQGERQDTWYAEMTKAMYPIFQELLQEGNQEVFPGFLANLETKVSPSTERQFPHVDFIDTPGLTDGMLNYKCDMNVITWLAGYADLVFVFFDPIGQALCQKTLSIVKEIFRVYPQKVKFCLTKIDEIKKTSDFNKLLSQVSMNLAQSLDSNLASADITPICLPDREYEPDKTQNRIETLVSAIDGCIKGKVEQNLARLKSDLGFVDCHLTYLLREDDLQRRKKAQFVLLRCVLLVLICALAVEMTNNWLGLEGYVGFYVGIGAVLGLACTFLWGFKGISASDRKELQMWKGQVKAGLQIHEELTRIVLNRAVKLPKRR